MDRKRLAIDVALGFAIMVLGGLAWSQQGELEVLEEQMAKVEARLDGERGDGPGVEPAGIRPGRDEGSRPPTTRRTPSGDAIVAPVVPRLGESDAPTANPVDFDATDPAVRGQLREVIQEEQEMMRAERRQERQQRREERLRAQINALADKTAMDADLTEQITDLLVLEQVEAMDVFQQARENFGWDEAREKVGALRTETDSKARDLLEDEEYAEYEKMRQEEMERWNRGPRGGNRGEQRDRRNADENRR